MAITTLAGAIAGEQQPADYIKIEASATTFWVDMWTNSPDPGTNVTGSASGSTYSSSSAQVAGQLYHVDPASGSCYVSTLKLRGGPVGAPVSGMVLLVDRIWQGGTYSATATTTRTVNSPTFPARDAAGSTNGDGYIAYMTPTTTFSGTTTVTLTYTNQAGTSGRTTTLTMESATAKYVSFFGLQAGDTGIRSIQSVAVGAAQGAGAYIVAVVRPLLMMPIDVGAKITCEDAITAGMPKLYDGTVPYVICRNVAANFRLVATYVETVG